MSALSSLGRVVSKIRPKIASHCLRFSNSQPLASTRLVQDRNCKARQFSSTVTIPHFASEQQSDIPSASVLSKLDIFGVWRSVPDIDSGDEQELATRAREAQRREKEEALKKKESDTPMSPYPVASGGGGCTAEDQRQHEGHGSDGANTGTGTDTSVPDFSDGYSGSYDGGA